MPFTPLSEETEFAFPDGVFDLRGWEVRAMTDGEKVGAVEDLLIDDAGTVRYLDVGLGARREHILVPLERTRADEAEMVVWVPGFSRAEFDDIPRYDHDPATVTDEYEARLADAFHGRWPESRRGDAERTGSGLAERGAGRPIVSRPRRSATPRWGPLVALAELGEYEVMPGDPDPRGWPVFFSDRRRIGEVHDLVFEPDAGKVRYLDCQVTIPVAGQRAGGRHVLVPIDRTRLDLDERLVLVDDISSAALADLPTFAGLPLAPEVEDRIYEVFDQVNSREGRDRR